MQDPFRFSNHQFQKPTPKPRRKQVGLLQPKVLSHLDNTAKSTLPKGVKRAKKSSHVQEAYNKAPVGTSGRRPVVDMMKITEGDSRSLYRALKRKYTTLEEESFKLVEELEKADSEVKKLEEEKSSLLDELLVLEGLAYNPYPHGTPAPTGVYYGRCRPIVVSFTDKAERVKDIVPLDCDLLDLD